MRWKKTRWREQPILINYWQILPPVKFLPIYVPWNWNSIKPFLYSKVLSVPTNGIKGDPIIWVVVQGHLESISPILKKCLQELRQVVFLNPSMAENRGRKRNAPCIV